MKSKKVLLPFLLLSLVQAALAQPLQRKAEQNNNEFSLTYTFTSDSLKGFFDISENFTGRVKLLNATCKIPYRFDNGHLQISGDKITAGTTASFNFLIQDESVLFSGAFHSENFGLIPYEMNFETVNFQKPVVLAQVKKETEKNETPIVKNQEVVNRNTASATKNDQPLTTNNKRQTNNEERSTMNVLPLSFRVQLAASVTPMDKEKLQKLSGLSLPVQEDRIDGYYKYTIGNEKNLQEAQVLLNRVMQANFKKPFIVAYRQNERITVQQAMVEINRLHP